LGERDKGLEKSQPHTYLSWRKSVEETNQVEQKKKAEYRQNFVVFLALVVLTLFEFFVAINMDDPTVLLLIIALVKAGLIVQFFMHIYRLWRTEEHE
jgi:heme/copper-type cytochrome/quinol oxidase subunit 4